MGELPTASRRLLVAGENRFGLLLLVGEETDSIGARKAAELEVASRYVVLGEPTDNRLAVAQKGTLLFRLETEGRAGHSAHPEAGRSAAHRLVRLMDDWLREEWGSDPRMGATTLNFGLLAGGTAANVIASRAWAEGMFRVADSASRLRDRLRDGLPEWASLRILSLSEPLSLTSLPGFATCVVAFGSDAPHLRPLGEVLMLGPGSIRHAHADDEQVGRRQLAEAAALYVGLVRRLLERL